MNTSLSRRNSGLLGSIITGHPISDGLVVFGLVSIMISYSIRYLCERGHCEIEGTVLLESSSSTSLFQTSSMAVIYLSQSPWGRPRTSVSRTWYPPFCYSSPGGHYPLGSLDASRYADLVSPYALATLAVLSRRWVEVSAGDKLTFSVFGPDIATGRVVRSLG